MSYIEIKKGRLGSEKMPNDILRVNRGSISVAGNVSEQFQSGRTTSNAGTERVKLGLAIDTDRQAIKLVPNSLNGFSFTTRPTSSSLKLNQPRDFRKAGLPIGDYVRVDDSLEFTLAR